MQRDSRVQAHQLSSGNEPFPVLQTQGSFLLFPPNPELLPIHTQRVRGDALKLMSSYARKGKTKMINIAVSVWTITSLSHWQWLSEKTLFDDDNKQVKSCWSLWSQKPYENRRNNWNLQKRRLSLGCKNFCIAHAEMAVQERIRFCNGHAKIAVRGF